MRPRRDRLAPAEHQRRRGGKRRHWRSRSNGFPESQLKLQRVVCSDERAGHSASRGNRGGFDRCPRLYALQLQQPRRVSDRRTTRRREDHARHHHRRLRPSTDPDRPRERQHRLRHHPDRELRPHPRGRYRRAGAGSQADTSPGQHSRARADAADER